MMGTRIQHVLRRRLVHVVSVDEVSPRMRRIVVGGDALDGFSSQGPDDHVKLFFPPPGADTEEAVFAGPKRDYTPLRFDPTRRELTIEFVLHGHGPAASWAARAQAGDLLGVGGPRGSLVPPDDAIPWVLIGDETALPSIARSLAEMPAGQTCLAFIEVADEAEIRRLPTAGHAAIRFLSRDGAAAGTGTALDRALRDAALPAPARYRIGAEIETARRLRGWLIAERGVDRAFIRAAGYWRIGAADGGGRIEEG